MKAPKSYTKEDVVEINCHGGPGVLKEVLGLVVSRGARIAEPGEFTKRAFLNGRIDLSRAEAVMDVIRAKTDSSLRAAVDQLQGSISDAVEGLIDRLSKTLAHAEAAVDFPDEDLEIMKAEGILGAIKGAEQEINDLLSTSDQGVILREGVIATICGKPNVGKSSLMNLLLKRDRVIVTPIPGTTRDAVEETINLKGFPVRLVDTAGISETEDVLEGAAVERSKRYLEASDMVIFVLDGSRPVDKEDLAIGEIIKEKKTLTVINKVDLARRIREEDVKGLPASGLVVAVSVKERRNIDLLEDGIVKLLTHGGVFREGAIVTNIRHKALLEEGLKHIVNARRSVEKGLSAEFVAQDLREAVYQLGLIVGRSVSDDVLDRIFSEFCIGK